MKILSRWWQKLILGRTEDKDSVTCPESHEDEDMISELPDEILVHTLSPLLAKDIIKTHSLSTRWKSLRSSLPRILYFDFHAYYDKDSDFINLCGVLRHGSVNHGLDYTEIHLDSFHDMVQSIPDGSRIAKFRLLCPLLLVNQSRLQSLLSHAARHKIEDMEFDSDFYDINNPHNPAMSFPHSLLNSDSLVSLMLTMQPTEIEFPTSIWLPMLQTLEFTARFSEFEFPTSVWLPSLKTLRIEWFRDWENLILPTCCPVLEELILLCRRDLLDIPIDSASLQRLTIQSFDSLYSSFKVNCYDLQSLTIYTHGHVNIQVCDFYHSLAEADINIDRPITPSYIRYSNPDESQLIILGLLESIRHVKSLKLSSSTVEGIQFLLIPKKIEVDYKLPIFHNLTLLGKVWTRLQGIQQFLPSLNKIGVGNFPIFYNLTHLELGIPGGGSGVILLVCILQKSPHLQSLKSRIEYHYYKENKDIEQYCLKDVVLPSCLEHCLKTVSISSPERAIDFLKYILKNAKVLEHFTVHWRETMSVEERMLVQQDLSTFFRSNCLYEFF